MMSVGATLCSSSRQRLRARATTSKGNCSRSLTVCAIHTDETSCSKTSKVVCSMCLIASRFSDTGRSEDSFGLSEVGVKVAPSLFGEGDGALVSVAIGVLLLSIALVIQPAYMLPL